MPITSRDILNAVSQLTKDIYVQLTTKDVITDAYTAAATAAAGGFIFGPIGLAIGV
jgi:hypothetical protein